MKIGVNNVLSISVKFCENKEKTGIEYKKNVKIQMEGKKKLN